jgi:hypothetical protein
MFSTDSTEVPGLLSLAGLRAGPNPFLQNFHLSHSDITASLESLKNPRNKTVVND